MSQKKNIDHLLQALPSVDRILHVSDIKELLKVYSRFIVIEAIRDVINNYRHLILTNKEENSIETELYPEEIGKKVALLIRSYQKVSLQKVINGTGVIIHTNLGRACLAESALAMIEEVARGYSNLEYSLDKGERGSRYSHLEELFFRLTDATGVMAVNNNAGALLLCLNTFAEGKEVIISRGELVEIGDGFRIPDVMRKSGAILREVGSTNRSNIQDYEQAITENTALLLKVHTSNFRIMGYTKDVSIDELGDLGRRYNIPVMMDLGSGCLIDLSPFNLKDEPFVAQVLKKAAAQIVTFSGDKLLGGPQAGIILTKGISIDLLRKNPLARALRIDKLTLAALLGTLTLYQHSDPQSKIPVLQFLSAPVCEIEKRANKLFKGLTTKNGGFMKICIVDSLSSIGGGSLPMQELPTKAICFSQGSISTAHLERLFRGSNPAIIGRIQDDCFFIDLRTVNDKDLDSIIDRYDKIVKENKG
ncbi:MAG: L-seryl-tRNA(Sec) selenium transferase [bacterium]